MFGNRREFFAYYSPHDTLTVRAVSLVRVRAPQTPDWAASPAWESVRERLLYRAGKPYVAEAEYTFGTHFSPLFSFKVQVRDVPIDLVGLAEAKAKADAAEAAREQAEEAAAAIAEDALDAAAAEAPTPAPAQ